MTAADVLARGRALVKALLPKASAAGAWAWRNRVLVLVVLVVVLAVLGLRSCQQARVAEAGQVAVVQRAAGEVKAEAAGIPVVHAVPQASVDEEGERAKREVPILKAQLDRVQKELGKVRLELVARVRTEPAPAQAPVAKGEYLQLGADLMVAETKDGAHILEGTLEARTVPAGEVVLLQPYSAPITIAVSSPPAPCPADAVMRSWRLGPVGGVSGQGWLVGGAYTRRLDFWGYRPEVLVTVAGGPGQGLVLVGPLF